MHACPEAWKTYSAASSAYMRAWRVGQVTPELREARRAAEHAAVSADPALYAEYRACACRLVALSDAPHWYTGSEEDRAKARELYHARKSDQAYQDAYRARRRAYVAKRRQEDEQYRICERLRARLRGVVRAGVSSRAKTYGVDWAAILEHLGPCPGNPADYHVDHVIPLSSFDLTDPEQVRLAFAPSNHQWLTSTENLKKSDKV
jgi:hypothetical protein